ncbi:MAG: hypothetical protein QNJ16_15085 [Rhodobacter sp.]|nr:hypothetical protein [Rhodobacter sp.]
MAAEAAVAAEEAAEGEGAFEGEGGEAGEASEGEGGEGLAAESGGCAVFAGTFLEDEFCEEED